MAFAVAFIFSLVRPLAAAPDFVHAEGKRLVDGHGDTFVIKEINLGHWLVPEGYMFKFKQARSPSEIAGFFDALIGPAEAARFWTEFRDVYITEEDIRFIKAAGFNTVRVPLNWRLFVDPSDAGAGSSEAPGWSLLDRLIQWCHEAGLRVIVDLHAAPGGQTEVDPTTARASRSHSTCRAIDSSPSRCGKSSPRVTATKPRSSATTS